MAKPVPQAGGASLINLLQWIRNPLRVLETAAQQQGDCFQLRLGSNRLIFVSHPEAIEQIFTAPSGSFESGRANLILKPTLGDASIILLDGDRHQRQRQLLMPPFHGERMRTYGTLIGQITQQVMDQQPLQQPFSVRPLMQEISLQVILQAVFGLREGDRLAQIQLFLGQLLDLTTSQFGFAMNFFPVLRQDYGAWSPGGRFLRLKQQIDRLLYAEIADRRSQLQQGEADSRTDILTLLLQARDAENQPMSDQELRDELMTLLMAGHETTATAITWALYWLHQLPEVKAKLLDEFATLDRNPDPMTIARLPYLNAVCSETLRIYPVGFIAQLRVTQQPIAIQGYEFPAETWLVPCVYLTHHRPDLYPDSKQFRPDRFLERQFSPYEFYAFGGSNRRCIGAAFALFEMKLVLWTLLTRYQFASADRQPVRPVRRGVTIAPSQVRLTKTQALPLPAPIATPTLS